MHVGEREIGIQAVERLAHIAQLARIALHATVRQTLEDRGEAEPLQLVGRGAVAIHILLGILGKASEQLKRLLLLPLDEQSLRTQKLIG